MTTLFMGYDGTVHEYSVEEHRHIIKVFIVWPTFILATRETYHLDALVLFRDTVGGDDPGAPIGAGRCAVIPEEYRERVKNPVTSWSSGHFRIQTPDELKPIILAAFDTVEW